jgi:hypothetical protein
MIMTLGADYSPIAGRAHFLGLWRLMSDIGSTGGPACSPRSPRCSLLAAASGAPALLAFAAAAVLWYWIPRTRAPWPRADGQRFASSRLAHAS